MSSWYWTTAAAKGKLLHRERHRPGHRPDRCPLRLRPFQHAGVFSRRRRQADFSCCCLDRLGLGLGSVMPSWRSVLAVIRPRASTSSGPELGHLWNRYSLLSLAERLPGGWCFPDVASIAINPGYSPNTGQDTVSIDLALVRLAKPLPSSFKPVELLHDFSCRDRAAVADRGLGHADEEERGTSGVLRTAVLAVSGPKSPVLII